MNNLWLYRAVSGVLPIKYRTKLLLIAFVGIQVPLLALIVYFLRRTAPAGGIEFRLMATAIIATLVGTFLTLTLLSHLLHPIFLTAKGLQRYTQEGILPDLPTQYTDEVGTLMAHTQNAVLKLDSSLRRLTDFDQSTALPTRETFMLLIESSSFSDSAFALCAVSVSNYDKIAAAFGQSAVHSVMVAIAARFREQVGEEVPLCRIGSNSFLFTLGLDQEHLDQEQLALSDRIEAIRLAVQKELVLPGFSLRPEINAGVSLHAGGPLDVERLINESISALAETHLESDIHTNFFSPQENERARDAFLLERDLRTAIEQEQFSVHYQPIVDTSIGRVVGAEALVRWTHPERGMVLPTTFIPIAEAAGLMDAIGMRVLKQVCWQLGRWSGTPLETIKVSINLSARQFLNPEAVLQIREELDANNVSPSNLEIELTETTVIQDTERTLLILQVLRKMGITIAIDDFGTGYSGLSYLKTLPFDRLKIDREFIQNVDQTVTSIAICKSLIELASGLGIEVLAEGTETAEEVGMMRSLGCGLYQGYHFAHPVPADKFLEAVQLIEKRLSVEGVTEIEGALDDWAEAEPEAKFDVRHEARLEQKSDAKGESGHKSQEFPSALSKARLTTV